MPTYEYACKSCGEHLEVVQSFTDDALTECPACAGPLRKVFSAVGITFKGSGFYKTDSRASSGKTASKEKESTSSSSDSSSSSSDSGPAKSDSSSTKSDSGSSSGKAEAKTA